MKTSTLIYKATRSNDEITVKVKVRLDDQCKNGHEDFSVTADVYQKGKPMIDKYMVCCGCCHEEVLLLFPELKQFVDLHLCDVNGAPMYAADNGFYRIRNNPEKWVEYNHLTQEEADKMQFVEDVNHYQYLLNKLGVIDRWKKEAQDAIKVLENLTGEEFESKATKLSDYTIAPELFNEMAEKDANGYYSKEAIEKRLQEKIEQKNQKVIADNKAKEKEEIAKIKREYKIKNALLMAGVDNEHFIYYSHSNTLTFNWCKYGTPLSKEFIEEVLAKIDRKQLPKNVKIEY